MGLSRVAGIREADDPAFAWIDLRTEHRFEPPVQLGEPPRRLRVVSTTNGRAA